VVYASFADYTADAEWLVTRPPDSAFDYVEGFAFVNSDDPVNGWPLVPFPGGAGFDPSLLPAGSGPVLYCLEVALYQHQHNRPNEDEEKVGGSGGVYFSAGGVCVLVYLPLDSVTGAARTGPRACLQAPAPARTHPAFKFFPFHSVHRFRCSGRRRS
jgi:hypothetical protein